MTLNIHVLCDRGVLKNSLQPRAGAFLLGHHFFCTILWVTSHFSKYFMGHYFVFVPPETKKYFFPKKYFFQEIMGVKLIF